MPSTSRSTSAPSWKESTPKRHWVSGEEAGVSASVAFDMSSVPMESELTVYSSAGGSAAVTGDVLKLTSAHLQETGSAVVHASRMDSMTYFEASFDVYLGGGSGGEGLSFSLGEMPSHAFDEHGVGSGLRVLLRTTSETIEVWHEEVLVASQDVSPASLRSTSWVGVTIAYGRTGLSVRHGGVAYMENVTLSGWSPLASWSFGFGARTSHERHDDQWLDNVSIRMGSAYESVSVGVEVACNGQQFSSSDVQLTYHPSPVASSVVEVDGRGEGFKEARTVYFSDSHRWKCRKDRQQSAHLGLLKTKIKQR